MFHFGLDEYSKDMLLSLTIKLVLVHDDDKHLATLKSFSVQRYFKSMETTRCHSNTYYVNLAFTECKKIVFHYLSPTGGIGPDGVGQPGTHYSQPYQCYT